MWISAFLISSCLAVVAYWNASLSKSGALGALGVGTLVLGGTGWAGFLVLAFFFISSSGISKWSGSKQGSDSKVKQMVLKGERRDVWQVLANGGVAALGALMYTWTSSGLWLLIIVSSLAAATSDTWSSEIGRWSRSAPRDVFNWREVEHGTSGAVSVVGTIAGIFGACLTAVISIPLLLIAEVPLPLWALLAVIAISGWFGNWMDTLVGSKWQVRFKCMICQQQTEQKTHCQTPTQKCKGFLWLDNDQVNLVCTLFAAFMSGIGYTLLT